MSRPGNDDDPPSATATATAVTSATASATATVCPWQTLASLGITEDDLTAVQDVRGLPPGAGTAAPVGSAGVSGGFAGARTRSRNVPSPPRPASRRPPTAVVPV